MKKNIAKLKSLVDRPIFKEISFYSLASFSSQLLSFISIFFVSRYLGPINLGLLSFVQNYAAILISSVLGMDYYFSWKISKKNNKEHYALQYFVYKIFILLLLILVGLIFAYFIFPSDVFVLTLFFLPLLIFGSTSSFYYYSLSMMKSKIISFSQIIGSFTIFVFKLSLFLVKAPLIYFAIATSLDISISAVILAVILYKQKEFSIKNILFHRLKFDIFNFVYEARFAILNIVSMQALLKVDQFTVSALSNAYNVGIYSAAVKIVEVANIFASILYLATLGRMSANSESHKKAFKIYLLSGLFISVTVMFLAKISIKIVYGNSFYYSSSVLVVYSLTIPSMYMFYYYNSIVGIREEYFKSSIIYIISACVNIFLAIILYRYYSLNGVAFSTAISYFFAIILFKTLHKKSV